MAEIINLRQARKAKKRTEATAQADANRAQSSLTKAERVVQRLDAEREKRKLDGARREKDD